jgi:acyl-coenzyme A synthetase/AMP-(fatty) acid ligase
MFCRPETLFASPRDPEAPAFLYNNNKIIWQVFCAHVAALSKELTASKTQEWLLYCDDTFLFAIGFFALLQANKTIILPQNMQPQVLQDHKNKILLTDIKLQSSIPTIYIEYLANISAGKEFHQINPDTEIFFYTSGSSGQPKKIIKQLVHLSEEISQLDTLFGNNLDDALFASTVSHQHIYGLLFRLLWPLCRGNLINSSISFNQEEISDLATISSNIVLISSPAFLKRLEKNEDLSAAANGVKLVTSSGGLLNSEAAQKTADILKQFPLEILGSTETGGIAYRTQNNNEIWQAFPKVQITTKGQQLLVKSPYILEDDYITSGDTAELIDATHFILKERFDRIIKIEEKRVSLTEIENRLKSHEFIENGYALMLEKHRQILGAVLVLNHAGQMELKKIGKKNFTILLKVYLLQYFEPVIIPRKWRFVKNIPINPQGKILHLEIKDLFEDGNLG